ncbi:alpha-rhamnosidase [Aureibaculum algae]|uniref:alpha-L-rhamnosidase n=1 Tax=Aureibaculum algae TaxID=2584122 RepID=A0A5B7TRC6_9FLAO|nr:alpha-L-rhamnosidase [Aureibaculum algae]QCX37774.1 alpha-rhamnosidase [Aureibaculum algae]
MSTITLSQTNEFSASNLRCEYLKNPIAVDVKNPRFTWKIEDKRNGALQSSYQIVIDTDSSNVAEGIGKIWNTGKMSSNATLRRYTGNQLLPFTTYYWAVTVWDKDNKRHSTPKVASFRTGMMQSSNWKGSWIMDTNDISLKPAAYFRKEFTLSKELKSAYIYTAVAGLYELELNGARVGDHQLDPTFTRFDVRNLYVTYDITNLLKKKNAISILLGNGWYNHQSTAVWNFHEALWRGRPRFCLDLRLEYTDGTIEIVSTDKSWKTSLSPVVLNSIYTGEQYNANLEEDGYNKVSFNDTLWKNSIVTQAPSKNIVSQQLHPIRAMEEIIPKSIRKISDKKYIFDLGRNISGVTKLSVSGQPQTEIRLIHSEILDNKGNLNLSNIDLHYRPTDNTDPFQTDIYTLKGEGIETFSPKFNYKGFQYVEVNSSQPIELTKESLTGIVLHSDVPKIGYINSSNNTLNKIWEATNNSYLSNLFGYPTDCPQREKNGWTGDAHIANETGLYNFDGITIYEKWLEDHRDEQQANGVLPSIIPSSGWGYDWGNGPDWTSTIAIIPWNIYLFYGDSTLLENCYLNIKRYVDHITEISEDNLTTWGLGDWIPVTTKPPVEYTSSIYYFVDVSILAKAAKLLGYQADFVHYSKLAEEIKSAFNKKYFNKETGIYGKGSQTELSTSLHWGMVPEGAEKLVAKNLADRVIKDKKHINVGLLGSKTILNALSDNGYAELAYEVASQETFPSWGWWIVNGFKTLPENWDLEKEKNDISHNHIMFGEISAWYFKALGGIKPDPNNPGFRKFILEPNFVKGLDHFEARFNSPQGEITSSWKRIGSKIYYHVVIPPNSVCRLTLKANNISKNMHPLITNKENGLIHLNLESGTYTIQIN